MTLDIDMARASEGFWDERREVELGSRAAQPLIWDHQTRFRWKRYYIMSERDEMDDLRHWNGWMEIEVYITSVHQYNDRRTLGKEQLWFLRC